jgi:hypothetical protein
MKKSVSLIDHDSVRPNLALMKLSAYFKKNNWDVRLNMPLFPADRVYISKVFRFSPSVSYPGECIIGGPGHDIKSKLPDAIDNIMPDYSLYNCPYSVGHTSRGCPNSCGFCIVPEGEGRPYVVGDIYSFWNKRHKNIVIMDSNILFDHNHFFKIASQIRKERLDVRFEQGLDIRRVNRKVCVALAALRFSRYSFSWDSEEIETIFLRNIQGVCKYISNQRLNVHVLVGYDTSLEYDYYRICELRKLGLTPFVMVYDKRRDSAILTLLSYWANNHKLASVSFRAFLIKQGSLHILSSSSLSGVA